MFKNPYGFTIKLLRGCSLFEVGVFNLALKWSIFAIMYFTGLIYAIKRNNQKQEYTELF